MYNITCYKNAENKWKEINFRLSKMIKVGDCDFEQKEFEHAITFISGLPLLEKGINPLIARDMS